MMLRREISEAMMAFLKRWPQVRLLPGALLFSKDLRVNPSAGGARNAVRKGVRGTGSVQARSPYGCLSGGGL